MTTNAELVSCPVRQVIKKYVREVPCPRTQPKKKQCVSTMEGKKQIDEVSCHDSEARKQIKCPGKPRPVCTKAVRKVWCPTDNEQHMSPKGCPKCEENRIQKLEFEVFQLKREIEHMKHDRKEVEKALQKAILKGACALGGGLKTCVPESIERLLDTCNSDVSSTASYSVTMCSARPPSTCETPPSCAKTSKKKEPNCCRPCCVE